MKNKSGEVVDWNRTPGKPSFNAQNHQQNQQGWNEPIDMWGNTNILSARANKPWTNEPQQPLNPFQNQNSWNNTQQLNGSFPINQAPANNAPLWGSSTTNINHAAMRPIRGPQPNQAQPPVMDGRNRQFSGWGLEIDSKPEDNFNNVEGIGQNLISSACSIASYTSIRNSKDPSKPESSLSVLNEMLNGLISENAGKDQAELDELIKAIINVNDAWGQRAVDQSTSWDISSINYDEVVTGPTNNNNQTGGNNQGSTTSLNPSAHAITSTQSQQQTASQQQQQQQRRIKPMSHAVSAANSADSNVWQNEPPTGTGIWEAHYESLGEKNLEWSSAASVSTQRQLPSQQHPSPQISSQVSQQPPQQPSAKASAIGRPMSFSTTSRQSNLGFRNQQPPNADSSSWNYLNSTSLWASNQSNMVHNELLNQQQQQSGGRPINKGSSSNPRGNNPPWPPTTNHPPPHNSDVFLGQPGSSGANATVWSSTHNPNSLDNRKFPSANSQVPGGAPSSMMLPQDYQNMMQRPPPPPSSNQSSAKARPPNSKSQLPQSNTSNNGPSSMQQSGFFRANVLRQLINLGFSEEEVQNSMVENNMDIERTLNDLRNKSAHIGLDALLNPIMGSNLFSSNSVSPPVVSNHFSSDQDPFKKVNGISPTDPSSSSGSSSFSALQLREQGIMKNIIQWNQKFSDISMKISQLMTMPSTNPLAVKELTQLRDQSIQQIHVFQMQLKSVRNQMAMLQQRDVDLSDRLSEMRLVNGGGPFSSNSNNWGSGDGFGSGGGWNNPPVSMHGDEFFDQNHHQSSHATNLAPGADRRWNNEAVNSNTNLSAANNHTLATNQQQKNLWPSSYTNKEERPITRHIIIKDLPSHITFDMIKMTVVSALSTGLDPSSQQQLNEEFELNPNMVNKWCLVSLASPMEAAHLMSQIGETNGDAKGFGHPEFISEEATMDYLEEIKNLSTFGKQMLSRKESKGHDGQDGNNQTDSGSPPNSPTP